MRGEMAGYLEARTRVPDRRLYRLFGLLEREAPGLATPSLVVLGGMSKAVGTAFTDAGYRSIRALGAE